MVEISANVQKNDVVLMVDDTQHRSKWHMDVTLDIHPYRKKRVHTIFVNVKGSLVKRPIHKPCAINQAKKSNLQP